MVKNKLKIFTVVGARPQFVKAAVVSRALRKYDDEVQEIILHTGQHYDSNMSDVFFEELDIPLPYRNLSIGGGSHGQNTGRMLEAIEAAILDAQPTVVLVYGDTDSTLAGALAAIKLRIPVCHVEAGIRSFNRNMPEEINRILTDHIADLLLVPTANAAKNLQKEGVPEEKVEIVGDVMFDATIYYSSRASRPKIDFPFMVEKEEFILCTIHRAENTDNEKNLRQIFRGLGGSRRNIVLPLHPRTYARLKSYGINLPDNVFVMQPVGYLEMNWLEANCCAIVTDSGGVQKEAFFHKKMCIILREETEWSELVEMGVNVLVGSNTSKIVSALTNIKFPSERTKELVYGDGRAGEIIAELIVSKFRQFICSPHTRYT